MATYSNYVKNLWTYEAAARTTEAEKVAMENQSRSVFEKWDAQNGSKIQALESQLVPLAEQIASTNTKLAACAAERPAKEAVLNKPRSEQATSVRQEIAARFAESRRSLSGELASVEVALKAETSRWPPSRRRPRRDAPAYDPSGDTVNCTIVPSLSLAATTVHWRFSFLAESMEVSPMFIAVSISQPWPFRLSW